MGNPRWGYARGVHKLPHASRVTQKIFAALVEWYHRIVLTMSFKLVSFLHLYDEKFFAFIFAVLLYLIIYMYKPSYSRFCLKSLLLKFDWHHLIACPGEPPVRSQRLGDISYTTGSYSQLNFVAMATGLVVTEFVWRHSIAHPRIPTTRCKWHHDIFHTSGVIACFVSNCVAMATKAGPVKIWLTSFDSLSQRTPYRGKHLGDISYTRRVKGDFFLNFVAMATGIGRGRICLTSFDSPPTNTPY